jgi:hypothetical protein
VLAICLVAAVGCGGDSSETLRLDLRGLPENPSVRGWAELEELGDRTRVIVERTSARGPWERASIEKRTCAGFGMPSFELEDFAGDRSETTVPASIAELREGGFAVTVYAGGAHGSDYEACGEIEAG